MNYLTNMFTNRLEPFLIVFKTEIQIKDDEGKKCWFRPGDRVILNTKPWKAVELCAKGIAEPFIESEYIHNAIEEVKKHLKQQQPTEQPA